SSTGTPALAKCAAICAPIVPAPRTATDRIRDINPSCYNAPLSAERSSSKGGVMIRWLATACLILTFSASARAQNAAISGTVVDESGAGVPGATVQLTGPRRELTTTGQGGTYRFSGLPSGTYQVTASLSGFSR